jgi:Ca-activated chloride channel family protein
MTGEISFACTLNREAMPALNQPQVVYALLEIAPTGAMANVRMPLNFGLVLDRSGSMGSEDKIGQLREAVKEIVDKMEVTDFISVVAFDSKTETLVPSQTAGDKTGIRREVDRLKARSSTEMAPALQAGLAEVKKQRSQERANRLLLLTDGHPTDDEEDSVKMAEQAGQAGIPIIALGLGSDWNEELLQKIADRSGAEGMADYIATPQDTQRIFEEVWQRIQIIAQDVTVTLRLSQGVNPRRVWQVTPLIKDLGYSPISDRFIEVPLGDLEQEGTAILAELSLMPRGAGRYRIAQAEASYHVRALGVEDEKVRADLIVTVTPEAYAAQAVNPRVMNIVERVTAWNLQTRALDEAQMGNLAGATQKLRGAVTILLNQEDATSQALAQTLQDELKHLEEGGQMSEEGKKTIRFTSRKTVKLSVSDLPQP